MAPGCLVVPLITRRLVRQSAESAAAGSTGARAQALVRAAATQFRITCDQLSALLEALPYQNERVAAAEAIGPLVVDRKGGVVRLRNTMRTARLELASVLAKHDVTVDTN